MRLRSGHTFHPIDFKHLAFRKVIDTYNLYLYLGFLISLTWGQANFVTSPLCQWAKIQIVPTEWLWVRTTSIFHYHVFLGYYWCPTCKILLRPGSLDPIYARGQIFKVNLTGSKLMSFDPSWREKRNGAKIIALSWLGQKLFTFFFTLAEIWWHVSERAFQELSNVFFRFFITIIVTELARKTRKTVLFCQNGQHFENSTLFDLEGVGLIKFWKLEKILLRTVAVARAYTFLEVRSRDSTWWPDLMWPRHKNFTTDVKLINEKVCQVWLRCSLSFSSYPRKTTGGGAKWPPPPPGRRLNGWFRVVYTSYLSQNFYLFHE